MPCSIDGGTAEWADQEDLIAWGRSVRVTSLEAGVGALPPPPHTASDPRGLYRWTGTQPSASTQVANRVHAPGTGLVTLDRLIQPSYSGALSLGPRTLGLTGQQETDYMVADGQTAIVNVTLFPGRSWAQIPPRPEICCPLLRTFLSGQRCHSAPGPGLCLGRPAGRMEPLSAGSGRWHSSAVPAAVEQETTVETGVTSSSPSLLRAINTQMQMVNAGDINHKLQVDDCASLGRGPLGE